MADSLITYCYVQPACSAFSLHSCKNSHVCGANDHETVIHFASCTTAPLVYVLFCQLTSLSKAVYK